MAKKERIDFGGVPKEIRRGGGATHIPAGDYLCKIIKHEKKWKDDDKSNVPYFSWQFQVKEGPAKGTTLYYITSLKASALFNLRNLIHAATSKNVSGKAVNFDPESLYGKTIGVGVQDEEWDNKIRSKAVDVFHPDEMEEDEDDDEDSDDEEESEEEEDEDLEEVDLDDL